MQQIKGKGKVGSPYSNILYLQIMFGGKEWIVSDATASSVFSFKIVVSTLVFEGSKYKEKRPFSFSGYIFL